MLLLSGIVSFIITAGLFWHCLPRDGKMHRFVGTELEPYCHSAPKPTWCSRLHRSRRQMHLHLAEF